MDDMAMKVIVGLALAGWLIITKWTYGHASNAHVKIADERKDSESRINLLHAKIKSSDDKTDRCREKIEGDMRSYSTNIEKILNNQMSKSDIKEHIGLIVGPLASKVDLHVIESKKIHEVATNTQADVRVINTLLKTLIEQKTN